jgi:hypothetical protein
VPPGRRPPVAPLRRKFDGHPERVLIATGTEVSHEHREAFDKLDDDGKDTFLWRFRYAINVPEADFVLDGADGILDCPSRFQISATRYEDGLTLTRSRRHWGQCSRLSYVRFGSSRNT